MSGRIRTIKPEFFTDEDLSELSIETRLLFVALWTVADREGRLEDKPRTIKLASFPWDDVDVSRCLTDLCESGFIDRYEVDGKSYIQIINFTKHQRPNHRELPSTLPCKNIDTVGTKCTSVLTRGNLDFHASARVSELPGGKGREGKGREREGEGEDGVSTPSPIDPNVCLALAKIARMQAATARADGDEKESRFQTKQAENFERRAEGPK